MNYVSSLFNKSVQPLSEKRIKCKILDTLPTWTTAVARSVVLQIIFLMSLYLENKPLPIVGTCIPVYREEMPYLRS